MDPLDTRVWQAPDLPAELTFVDYRTGRDPAMELILHYKLGALHRKANAPLDNNPISIRRESESMRVVEKFMTSAPPDRVWQVLADVEHWRDWTPTVVEIKPLSNKGLSVGARYQVNQPKLRPAVYEVTKCTPNEEFTWVQKLPGGAMIADHRLTPHGDGTEVELSFTSKGLLATVLGTLFSKMITDYVRTEARSLKTRVATPTDQ